MDGIIVTQDCKYRALIKIASDKQGTRYLLGVGNALWPQESYYVLGGLQGTEDESVASKVL